MVNSSIVFSKKGVLYMSGFHERHRLPPKAVSRHESTMGRGSYASRVLLQMNLDIGALAEKRFEEAFLPDNMKCTRKKTPPTFTGIRKATKAEDMQGIDFFVCFDDPQAGGIVEVKFNVKAGKNGVRKHKDRQANGRLAKDIYPLFIFVFGTQTPLEQIRREVFRICKVVRRRQRELYEKFYSKGTGPNGEILLPWTDTISTTASTAS